MIMDNRLVLMKLWAWAHWYRVCHERGTEYGLPLLKRGFDSSQSSLRSASRNTVIRLASLGRCINCETSVPSNSTGNHLVPISKGGSQSIENFAPLCKSCNSSKGPRDLLEWWVSYQRKTIARLNLDALCVYLRLTYQILEKENRLAEEVPDYYLKAIQQAAETLPSKLRTYFESVLPCSEVHYHAS